MFKKLLCVSLYSLSIVGMELENTCDAVSVESIEHAVTMGDIAHLLVARQEYAQGKLSLDNLEYWQLAELLPLLSSYEQRNNWLKNFFGTADVSDLLAALIQKKTLPPVITFDENFNLLKTPLLARICLALRYADILLAENLLLKKLPFTQLEMLLEFTEDLIAIAAENDDQNSFNELLDFLKRKRQPADLKIAVNRILDALVGALAAGPFVRTILQLNPDLVTDPIILNQIGAIAHLQDVFVEAIELTSESLNQFVCDGFGWFVRKMVQKKDLVTLAHLKNAIRRYLQAEEDRAEYLAIIETVCTTRQGGGLFIRYFPELWALAQEDDPLTDLFLQLLTTQDFDGTQMSAKTIEALLLTAYSTALPSEYCALLLKAAASGKSSSSESDDESDSTQLADDGMSPRKPVVEVESEDSSSQEDGTPSAIQDSDATTWHFEQ